MDTREPLFTATEVPGYTLKAVEFTATLYKLGINPCVDVPPHVVKALGGAAKIAVFVRVENAGTVRAPDRAAAATSNRVAKDAARLKAIGRLTSGGWFRTTIVSARSKGARLYIDQWMRQVAGADVGDSVRVTLKIDPASREPAMPDALRRALDDNAAARAGWEQLAPSRRREILSYLNFLKHPAALEQNVRKTIAALAAAGDRRE